MSTLFESLRGKNILFVVCGVVGMSAFYMLWLLCNPFKFYLAVLISWLFAKGVFTY